MIYRITFNEKRQKQAALVKNRKAFMALRNSKTNLANLAKARQGDTKAKAKLVQFAYNLGHAEGPLAGCKSIGSFFFHDIDCYSEEESVKIKEQILAKKDDIGLMMLERSASGGYHLICKRLPGTTIRENQVRVATILQIEMDTNAHDLQRVSFSTSGDAEDLIYLDDALFDEPMTAEECEAEYARLRQREKNNEEQVPQEALKSRKHFKPWAFKTAEKAAAQASPAAEQTEASQVPSTMSRIRFIIDQVLESKHLERSDFINIGGRHNAVKVFLSGCNLLLEQSEALLALSELMPDHWRDKNIQNCVTDFYGKYYHPTQRLTREQEDIYTQSMRMVSDDTTEQQEQLDKDTPMYELTKLFESDCPPEIPEKLPKLVEAVLINTPQMYKGTVAQAIFPGLMAYSRNLSFVYIDNQERELRSNCLIIAETGSGKDRCTSKPLEHIIEPMKKRDEINRKRLKAFNDECNAMPNNMKKPKRPTDMIIQHVMYDITPAGLVQRMDDAQDAPLYVRMNELELWDKVEGSSGRKNQFTTLKLCDDEGNEYGADRAGTQSVTAIGCLRLNWNANTTPAKAIKYFRYVMTDGPISRLCLATIPEKEIGAATPVFGRYTKRYDEVLAPYIEHLRKATGVIECKEAKALALQLKEECADFARLTQDRVFDNLSHRALVLAFRKACMLYAANGMKWEKSIGPFCRWSLFYDMWCKMHYFGEYIRHADDDIMHYKRGPKNLLGVLPKVFTLADAIAARQKAGLSTDVFHTKKMITSWISRRYLKQQSDNSYKQITLNIKD